MEKRLLEFIESNELSPFNQSKTLVKSTNNSIYKTRDAKAIHTKVLQKISQNFNFADTSNLLQSFRTTNNLEILRNRQEFFKTIKQLGRKENSFLKELAKPKAFWKPDYDVVVVTEDTDTFTELKKRNCPVQLLVSEMDITLLENRDVVQVINCPEYKLVLEQLPQSVFLNSIDETYLERHLETFSGWEDNLEHLKVQELSLDIKEMIDEFTPLFRLIKNEETKILALDEVEEKVEAINHAIYAKLEEQTISGASLVAMLNKGVLPAEIKDTVEGQIEEKDLPLNILNVAIPVTIDIEELDKLIKKQSSEEFSNKSERITREAHKLREIPTQLKKLSNLLILFDFVTGISKFIKEEMSFPEYNTNLIIDNSKNLFIDNAHPITFNLSEHERCSILTGANSGGKTTLIEHLIQLITLSQLGLPTLGELKIPLFEEVYYFAKNKGSMSKGAFETLLTQMSEIKPGNKTLILADEIEAVTEPGVAGKIISATADYYINQNCFLVIATHLGHEIQKQLPLRTRIDGIEAKGLDSNFNLVIDHNPILGRIANSTPELIVEKMANSEDKEYFRHLHNYIKRQ